MCVFFVYLTVGMNLQKYFLLNVHHSYSSVCGGETFEFSMPVNSCNVLDFTSEMILAPFMWSSSWPFSFVINAFVNQLLKRLCGLNLSCNFLLACEITGAEMKVQDCCHGVAADFTVGQTSPCCLSSFTCCLSSTC